MTDYQWYKEHHICVRCHHNEASKGHVTCLDCRDKEREVDRERKRKKLADETPEHKAERLRKMKERRERLKEQGICVWCGKHKVLSGKQQCLECYIKRKRINREYKSKKRNESRVLSGTDTQGSSQRCGARGNKGGKWSWV